MKDLNYYFDLAKKKTGSDRQTAIRMKIAPNRISMAREKGVMSNEFCANLAEIAGVDPLEVIAAAEVKKHPEKAQFWGKWIAASVILSCGILGNLNLNSKSYAHSTDLQNYRLCAIMVLGWWGCSP